MGKSHDTGIQKGNANRQSSFGAGNRSEYQHLKTLLPFVDADQLKLYDEAMDQIVCLNQQIESRNETQKENIRQKRKQKQDAFWEVTGVSYMMDEFSDAKKKKK